MALHYSDPKRSGNVIWTQFLRDIEQGNETKVQELIIVKAANPGLHDREY